MRHKGPRFPIRASTAEEKRKRGAFIADIERQTGFPLTASEIARSVRLRHARCPASHATAVTGSN